MQFLLPHILTHASDVVSNASGLVYPVQMPACLTGISASSSAVTKVHPDLQNEKLSCYLL